MSYTEIYGFSKNGKVKYYDEVKNAFRGAMAIWQILERKYLPSLDIPDWAVVLDEKDRDYWSRTFSIFSSKEDKMREIWSLVNSDKLSFNEKIVLASTLDNVLIKKKNFDKLIKAFREFEGETSLKEQADIIELFNKNKDIFAIGFNQTSGNGDTWENYNYNDKKEESYSYNCLKQNDHWWLFDDIKEK